jgi:exodeoxyribonuclease-3
MPIRTVATWNVNSIRTRLEQVLGFLKKQSPDLLCLQETKTPDDRFPEAAFREAGYESACAGQKAYNGVAIVSREPLGDVRAGFPGDPDPAQARVLWATWRGVRVVNVYVPNGSPLGSPRYAYKLAWFQALRRWLDEAHDPASRLLVAGDFNVAPEDRDVHDPAAWRGQVLCSAPEREALRHLMAWGLTDLLRRHHDGGGIYSWWDYRAGGFRRDEGLRIDLMLATGALAARSTGCRIDRGPRGLPQPSDHAPMVADFDLPE